MRHDPGWSAAREWGAKRRGRERAAGKGGSKAEWGARRSEGRMPASEHYRLFYHQTFDKSWKPKSSSGDDKSNDAPSK